MSEFEPVESPIIRLDGYLELNWFNTCIRTFKDEAFDHVEYYDPESKIVKGLKVSREILDLLFDYDFSYRYDPYVDDASMEWYIQSEAVLLEQELDDI